MTVYISDAISDRKPLVSPTQAGIVHSSSGEADLPATLSEGDIIKLAWLPEGCLPAAMNLGMKCLDSGSALILKVGLLNAAGTDLVASTDLVVSTTKGQTGGMVPMDSKYAFDPDYISPSENDRVVAAKVTTGAAGKSAGKMWCVFMYRPTEYGK